MEFVLTRAGLGDLEARSWAVSRLNRPCRFESAARCGRPRVPCGDRTPVPGPYRRAKKGKETGAHSLSLTRFPISPSHLTSAEADRE
jgi:hypothetical protein